MKGSGAMRRNPWIKLAVLIGVATAIGVLLQRLPIDFSPAGFAQLKVRIGSFGVWGPVIYIVFFIITLFME